jgi:hypothetical protein
MKYVLQPPRHLRIQFRGKWKEHSYCGYCKCQDETETTALANSSGWID